MFKKKTDKHANAGTFSLQTEISKNSPLTAAPAERYAFSLRDALGELDSEKWYEKRLDELSNIIDETAGNYVDREIVAAMEASLKDLSKQRGEHVSTITNAEQLEESEADGLSDSIEDLLIKLAQAKHRHTNITKKGAR